VRGGCVKNAHSINSPHRVHFGSDARSLDFAGTMTIFMIVSVIIVIAWLALTALFWMSFKEDKRVHPIYRSNLYCSNRNQMPRSQSLSRRERQS
jgi:hypothetical protein